MEIRYVEWGLANNFGDYIEVNRGLLDPRFKQLHDSILWHEKKHTNELGFTSKDFMLDIGPSNVNYWQLFKFMCMNPKSFLQFAPIYKHGKEIVYDINLCIVWGLLLTFVIVGIILGAR